MRAVRQGVPGAGRSAHVPVRGLRGDRAGGGCRDRSRKLRGGGSPREVRSALVYVLQNGRKPGAWSARCPDVFSSGRWFEGWRDGGAESGRPLPRARTWLLNLGWRRRGLIGLLELPAAAHPVRASA